ncbi:MAG: flagellar hook-length control protein FliK [Desulfobacteraceae bacterium]|jgi:hypothetical protein
MNILSVTGLSSDLVIETLKEKTKGQNPLEALKLKDNQILEAKVLKVFSQSQALLLVAGQKLTATTQMPLSENETLVLKVARNEGKQVLRRMEAAPPVNPQSEGLSEMRMLGREGPFARLSDILNTSMPGEIPETMASEAVSSDTSLDKGLLTSLKDWVKLPSGEPIKTPQPLSPGMEKTIDKTMASSLKDLATSPSGEQIKTSQNLNPGVEKTISTEKASTPSFVQSPKIPFEFKLALLVSEKPVDTQPSLEKPLAALTRELVDTFSSRQNTFKSSQPILNSEPPPVRLEQSVKQSLEALPPEEKNMARQFVESKAQSWEAKMTQVLLSGDSKAPSEAVSTLRNMLMDIAKGNAGGDDTGVRHSMIIEKNPDSVRFEEPPLPLDTATKSGPVPATASQAAPGSPFIQKEQADALLKQDGKTDFLPGAKSNIDLPQVPDQTEDALTNVNKKSAPLPLIPVEDNPTHAFGKEVISDKNTITKPLPLPASFRNPAPEVPSESPPSASIKRDLENIFTRIETSLEKHTGIFDDESTQTMALVKKIKDLVSSFTLRAEQPFDESTVKNLVRDSGLMWENKLKDLAVGLPEKKGVLTQEQTVKLIENDVKALALKGMNLEDGVKHNVSETLKTFTESLEKMQVLNSQSSDDSGKYLLPLPYVHNGHIRFGQLLIDLDRKQSKEGGEKDRIIRVAFILDMSRLGPIQAGVSLYKKSMSGEFLVGNADVKTLVDEALPGLVDELALKGYTVKKMECRLSDPETLAGTNLVEKLVDPRDGSVSIRI